MPVLELLDRLPGDPVLMPQEEVRLQLPLPNPRPDGGLPSLSLGGAPVFPSAKDRNKPTSRDTFQVWLRRAKVRAIESAPEEARADLKARFRGVGYHAEKRALVRDPDFRNKAPKIQEEFVGTNHGTLRKVYDKMTPDDLRQAMGFPEPFDGEYGIDTNRESEPRMNIRAG